MKAILKYRYLIISTLFFTFLLFVIFSFYNKNNSNLNEIGDAFGIFNAFFSALSVLFIYETLTKQQEEIKQTQIQYADEKMINLIYKHVDYFQLFISKVPIESHHNKDVDTYISSITKCFEDSINFKKHESIEFFLNENMLVRMLTTKLS